MKDNELDPITEKRVKELVNILLPYGFSYVNERYIGASPFMSYYIPILIEANTDMCTDEGGIFAIGIDIPIEGICKSYDEALGFYIGIMSIIAPELHCVTNQFNKNDNVIVFGWHDCEHYTFPLKVEYQPK